MILSQSRVKTWETNNCKKKAYAEMSGEVVIPPTEAMLRGSFFETGCLGSGVKGQMTTDLPRLASGKKSIEQIRIESQIHRFHELFDPLHNDFMGWQITDRQLHLTDSSRESREGTIDFACRRDDVRSIWDLKLNGDLLNPGGWWATPWKMDHIQMATYKQLYRENYSIDPETYYILFDYSPKLNVKVLKINISEESLVNYLQRFDVVQSTLLETEFNSQPSFAECNKCLVANCSERAFKPIIAYEEYDV